MSEDDDLNVMIGKEADSADEARHRLIDFDITAAALHSHFPHRTEAEIKSRLIDEFRSRGLFWLNM